MTELENYHLATIIVINDSCKNHQRMLKLVGENFVEEQDIYINSKYLPTKFILHRKIVTFWWKNPVITTLTK